MLSIQEEQSRIAVEKHPRQLERNEDGCASTAKSNAMVDSKHFGTRNG
jgi:hypothetical protein